MVILGFKLSSGAGIPSSGCKPWRLHSACLDHLWCQPLGDLVPSCSEPAGPRYCLCLGNPYDSITTREMRPPAASPPHLPPLFFFFLTKSIISVKVINGLMCALKYDFLCCYFFLLNIFFFPFSSVFNAVTEESN